MTTPHIQITSKSVEETRLVGEKIGRRLSSGLLIVLIGDLGSGKTAFVQGLAKGLEVSEKYYITSPTYTIINSYPGRLTLFHVDLYRLENPDDFENIGLYDIINDRHIVAVEWGEKLAGENFPELLEVKLDIMENDARFISMGASGSEADNIIRVFTAYF